MNGVNSRRHFLYYFYFFVRHRLNFILSQSELFQIFVFSHVFLIWFFSTSESKIMQFAYRITSNFLAKYLACSWLRKINVCTNVWYSLCANQFNIQNEFHAILNWVFETKWTYKKNFSVIITFHQTLNMKYQYHSDSEKNYKSSNIKYISYFQVSIEQQSFQFSISGNTC